MKDIVYAIPSHKRIDVLLNRTLAFLQEHLVEHSSIYIFVSKENIDSYKEKLPIDINLIESVEGVSENRMFISNYFLPKQKIVYLDDDIKSVNILENKKLKPIKKKKFQNETKYIFDLMIANDVGLTGVYPCNNAYFMKGGFSTDLKFCIGALRFVINDRLCERRRYVMLEDYETTIKYYAKYGKVIRLNYMSMEHDYNKLKGGMKDNVDRSFESKEIECEKFKWQYSNYCKIWKNKKRIEIKFKRTIEQPEVNTMWIGNKLNPIGRLSIQSWLNCGYKVNLHLYDKLDEEILSHHNIVVKDANKIMNMEGLDKDKILPFSDAWRYKFLYECGGLWCDTDIVMLEQFPNNEEIMIASEATLQAGTFKSFRVYASQICVLRFPPKDELIEDVLLRLKRKRTKSIGVDNMRIFQRAVCDSYFYDEFVQHYNFFAPLHWFNAKEAYYDTDYKTKYAVEQDSNDKMLRNAFSIHLWNNISVKKYKIDFDKIKDKSLFKRLQELIL